MPPLRSWPKSRIDRLDAARLTRRTFLLGAAGVVSAGLVACGTRENTNASRPATRATPTIGAVTGASSTVRLRACATTTQIQDFVRNVGGDRVEVLSILKPNVDPHDFEPTVATANDVAMADIIFVHGIGLDRWMDKVIQNAATTAPVVVTTSGVPLLAKGGLPAKPGQPGDPHVWFDPERAKQMVDNIRQGLSRIDPGGAASYQANAARYRQSVDVMDRQATAIYDRVPEADRKLVTNHDAFAYLAQHFHLTVVGAVIPSLDDSAEPTAKQINALIDEIDKAKVKAIFAESSANPVVAQQVAFDTGVKIGDNLYGDTLGPPGSDGDTYIKMMLADANLISGALA